MLGRNLKKIGKLLNYYLKFVSQTNNQRHTEHNVTVTTCLLTSSTVVNSSLLA